MIAFCCVPRRTVPPLQAARSVGFGVGEDCRDGKHAGCRFRILPGVEVLVVVAHIVPQAECVGFRLFPQCGRSVDIGKSHWILMMIR